jgi:hypothetical protein
MPGFVATVANQVMCSHGGQGKPIPPVSRVYINMQPVITLGHTYVIAACGLTGSPNPPCANGRFTVGATRVMAMAPGSIFPVLVVPGTGLCVPTGQPLIAAPMGQARVFAT